MPCTFEASPSPRLWSSLYPLFSTASTRRSRKRHIGVKSFAAPYRIVVLRAVILGVMVFSALRIGGMAGAAGTGPAGAFRGCRGRLPISHNTSRSTPVAGAAIFR